MKVLALITALFCLLHLFPLQTHAAAEPAACLLLEARTGTVLSGERTEEPLPIGSLAKLMTAHLAACAIEKGDLSTETVLTADDAVTGTKGAVIWLEAGDTITVDELLMGLLAGNANDAAVVLAKGISGDIPTFVDDMNAAAFDLGMRHTRFTSPQGYDDPAQYSTAADLGKLACAVLAHDVLTPYLTTWRTFIREDRVEIVNENTFTRTMEGCRGLKAAHSEASGYSLIAARELDGMVCVAIVLGCADKDERFTQAKKLLQSGFSSFHLTTPNLLEECLMPLKVKGGTASAVLPMLAGLPELTVPNTAGELETVLVTPDFLQAPFAAGDRIGMVYFYHDDTLLCEVPLLAAESVEQRSFRHCLQRLLYSLFGA